MIKLQLSFLLHQDDQLCLCLLIMLHICFCLLANLARGRVLVSLENHENVESRVVSPDGP